MRILLTNDDGIDSSGIQSLKRVLEQEHEVWVVAPDSNRSASSHSMTMGSPTRIHRIGEREFMCGGTPVDCILIAFLGLVQVNIDLVISGINLGPNLGTDIVYSGTAGAARQGALMGKPAVACSLNGFSPPFHFKYPTEFITRNLNLFCSLWAGDHFLNINFPNNLGESIPRVTFPTRRIYKDELVQFKAPNGDIYCFLGGAIPESEMEQGSDYWTIERGYISLSPVLIHPSIHEIEEKYRGAAFWVGKSKNEFDD